MIGRILAHNYISLEIFEQRKRVKGPINSFENLKKEKKDKKKPQQHHKYFMCNLELQYFFLTGVYLLLLIFEFHFRGAS